MLEQKIASGIGNIYANEILFMCRVNPKTVTSSLSLTMINQIITSARTVLQEAIKCGGTTVSTFTNPHHIDGQFSLRLQVHGRAGQPCFKCHAKIIKTKINNRGTYFCPRCQKLPASQNH